VSAIVFVPRTSLMASGFPRRPLQQLVGERRELVSKRTVTGFCSTSMMRSPG
jgi:hypothetical protein